MALAKRFGPEFGLGDPERELSAIRSKRAENGRITARYQQTYQGVPVLGGELLVHALRHDRNFARAHFSDIGSRDANLRPGTGAENHFVGAYR